MKELFKCEKCERCYLVETSLDSEPICDTCRDRKWVKFGDVYQNVYLVKCDEEETSEVIKEIERFSEADKTKAIFVTNSKYVNVLEPKAKKTDMVLLKDIGVFCYSGKDGEFSKFIGDDDNEYSYTEADNMIVTAYDGILKDVLYRIETRVDDDHRKLDDHQDDIIDIKKSVDSTHKWLWVTVVTSTVISIIINIIF